MKQIPDLEIQIYQNNIKELQQQLKNSYIRIKELKERCQTEERITLAILKDYQKRIDTKEFYDLSVSFQHVISWIEQDK
jgi:predicted RNase H-like nuclease (RuvC/YqgF family)